MEATHSGLTSLGWHPDDPAVRDVVPAISRGHNLVVVTPPAPPYAAAVLAGILDRRSDTRQAIFVIAPAPGLEEWGSLVAALAADLVPGPLLALGSRQAERRFRSGEGASLTIASPATAVALRQHSLIQPETIGAVVIAWPELWEDPDALTIALHEVPKEAQRVIITSDPGAIAAVIERHAWRAMTVGYSAPAAPSATPVQTVSVPWAQRVRVIAAVSERLGAASLAVWTADTSRHAELERVMAGIGVTGRVTTGQPEPAAHVIAFDPPPAERLAQLAEAGSVTLLMPPGTERWIERVSSARKPLVISATLDSTDVELSRRRSLIDQAVREGPLDEGLLALGPLFDRHDPASVAAALYQMWTRLPRPALTRQLEEGAAAAPRTRIWLGAGKRDEIGVGDVVGLLINEVRMDRAAIGRIELRDTFTLVEVPAPEAERIAQSISGKTLRRRRLVARVDRKGSH
jgi:hypothetical protein